MKISFVTNLCAHYNVGTFELLAREYDMDFYFFSTGDEWYWPQEHGSRKGKFYSQYLPGFHLGGTRITLSLPWKLLRGGYDAYIKCINGRFALPITYLIARIRRRPFILWTGVWVRLQTRIQRLIFPVTRYIYRHSDAIVVYGEHVRRYLMSEGVASERIFVAPHATDNSFYSQPIPESEKEALRSSLGVTTDEKVVLYLGRLEESKGVHFLVEAFAALNRTDALLLIAGNGTLKSDLEALVLKLGIGGRVRFAGYVPIESAPRYYSIAWTYVLPSVTTLTGREPWGLVVNEALNQGVPVVVTETVGAAAGGLVQDGLNGFIVPERDAAALAGAIDRMLSNGRLRREMSVNARKSISTWDYERNVQGYREAIEYALSRSRRNTPRSL